jgi:hypothetical protein
METKLMLILVLLGGLIGLSAITPPQELWFEIYGYGICKSLELCDDGTLLLTGYEDHDPEMFTGQVTRITPDGDEVWSENSLWFRSYRKGRQTDEGLCMALCMDDADFGALHFYSAEGAFMHSTSLDPYIGYGSKCALCADNAVVGMRVNICEEELEITKVAASGQQEWFRRIGSGIDASSEVKKALLLQDGGYLAALRHDDAPDSLLLIRTDEEGYMTHQSSTFLHESTAWVTAIDEGADGTILVACDEWLYAFDDQLQPLWEQSFDYEIACLCGRGAAEFTLASDAGILTGITRDGEIRWSHDYGWDHGAYDMLCDAEENCYLTCYYNGWFSVRKLAAPGLTFAGNAVNPSVVRVGHYPNPVQLRSAARAGVAFWFSLPQDASQQSTHLCIYDVKGRVVSRLTISDADVRAGCVTWHGSTESGKRLSSGVYLYRLDAGRQSLGSGKMLVVE